jgi:rfaE bifunctional protein kinase chain/domain
VEDPELIISSLQGVRVLVVGDCMLDEYRTGDVDRVSPEAPVPVVLVTEVGRRAGGALNAAAGVAALGGCVTMVSVTGDDAAADLVSELANEACVQAALVRDSMRRTTVKTRVYGRGQQMLRLDVEDVIDVSDQVAASVVDLAMDQLESVDAVLLSDYAKGVCTERVCARILSEARRRGLPAVVDPKASDFARYKGATVITPNLSEARRAASPATEAVALELAKQLSTVLPETAVLLTLGVEGMLLYSNGRARSVPTRAREVFDVTGAGDSVAATCAAVLGTGASLETAMELSNLAAAVTVRHLGAVAVDLNMLREELRSPAYRKRGV